MVNISSQNRTLDYYYSNIHCRNKAYYLHRTCIYGLSRN